MVRETEGEGCQKKAKQSQKRAGMKGKFSNALQEALQR